MHARNHVRLFHGPYRTPALRHGDHATCLFRDGEVIVTGWSDARIPSLALQYWFGTNETTVWRWRKALGVAKLNEGSARLRVELNREYGAAARQAAVAG